MTDRVPRILIVDDEYLVAMDVERIFTSVRDCEIVISNSKALEDHAEDEPFDLVVFDTGVAAKPPLEQMAAIRGLGAKIAFSTTADELTNGVPGYEDVPVLLKPYDERKIAEIFEVLIAR